jgi:hypothetical protein
MNFFVCESVRVCVCMCVWICSTLGIECKCTRVVICPMFCTKLDLGGLQDCNVFFNCSKQKTKSSKC